MKKITILLFITFSFSQDFSGEDITITIDNTMQSIDISNYLTLESGYYRVEPIFVESFSSTLDNMTASFVWNVNEFWSEFAVDYQCNYDNYGSVVCDMGVYDQATISVQNSTLNIMWADEWVTETISFDLVLRVSGLFNDTQLGNNDSNIPQGYSLDKPYPNPFNPTTTISFSIPSYDFISIKIYDLNGRLVETLTNKYFSPGKHNFTWNGEGYASGKYIVQMKSENYNKSQTLTLIK